jgi:hypothetical protein
VTEFKVGDKVRSKHFGGAGDTILAYFDTAKEARKVYDITPGYGSDKPVVIYSVNPTRFGHTQVSWDFAESVELVASPATHKYKIDDRIRAGSHGTVYTVTGLVDRTEVYQVTWPTGYPTTWDINGRDDVRLVGTDRSELLGLADNLIFAYGITDPNGHTGDVLKQLVAALREETSNDNA